MEDLDELITCYILHRHDFGMEAAPLGAVILYAMSCSLWDADLSGRHDLLARGKARQNAEADGSVGSDGGFRLKHWNQRKVADRVRRARAHGQST